MLAMLIGLGTAAPAFADPYALQITRANAARLLPDGSDAIGGIDDWALGNGTLCAVVSDPGHESVLSTQGGVLIDLVLCGRGGDQFNMLQPLFNLSREKVPPIRELLAEQDDAEARIVTTGELDGVAFETVYSLGVEEPRAFRIRTRLQRNAPGSRMFLFGDVSLHGNGELRPFTLSMANPELSVGFDHPKVDVDSPLSMLGAIVPADLQVWVGGDDIVPGIAYGMQLVSARLERGDGSVHSLPHFAIDGVDFSLFALLTNPLWLGDPTAPGSLELLQSLFMDLEPGDSLVYERRLLVGERADVASITDQVWPEAPQVSGRVDDPSTRLRISLSSGAPITNVRPERDGRVRFRLPSGRYSISARAPGGRRWRREIEVKDQDVDLGLLALGAPARLRLPRGRAMRLVFVGLDGTPTPRFGRDFLDFRVGGQPSPPSTSSEDVSLAGVPGDPESVVLRPGRYRILATRGPEYSVTEATVVAVAGKTIDLDIESPQRLIHSPGWLSADLHVHAERSDDSALPMRTRVASFVAQATDLLVATDHDAVTDYGPLIRKLGLASQLASMVGAEVTSSLRSERAPHTTGHSNVFPLPYLPLAYRRGSPSSEGGRLRDLVSEVRALGGKRIVQLNHPRSHAGTRRDGNLFTHLAVAGEPFDPMLALDRKPNLVLIEKDPQSGLRDLDFDTMELMNGPSMQKYWQTRADWYALLLQGEFRSATANSDSHHLNELVALPRNYVRMKNDEVASFDQAAFIAAVRAGRSYGTTGPLLDLRLGKAEIGDRFVGSEGVLVIRVRAAPWVPVSRARVFVDGNLTVEFGVVVGETREVPLTFERDAFVTVEVEGTPSELYSAVAPGFRPFAFTNPIFVDADGDGRWQAPGYPEDPESLPPAIREPLPR